MLNIKRLLNTELGRFFISVIIGLGLATLFRKSCNDKNCIVFDGPVINEVDGKVIDILASEGQKLAKNDPIIDLEKKDYPIVCISAIAKGFICGHKNAGIISHF